MTAPVEGLLGRAESRHTEHLVVKGARLWAAQDLVANGLDYGYEYLTDVFRREARPPLRSVVIAVGEQPHRAIINSDMRPLIVGLAVVRSIAGVAQGKVRVKLQPWREVEPVALADVLAAACEGYSEDVDIHMSPEPMQELALGARLSRRVINVLMAHDPSIREWIEDATDFSPLGRVDPAAESRGETRDALRIASRLANVDLPDGTFVRRPKLDTQTLLESVLRDAHQSDLEEDLLPDELRRFDGTMRAEMRSASVAMFRSDKFQLTVFNVNKKPVEVILGVDLIYWDITNDVFTLIQYKRLERRPRPNAMLAEWVYTRENEIVKQLALMPTAHVPPKVSADWRMTQTPFWFKFVRGDAGSTQDNTLLRGMYLPADYLRLAIEDGSLRTGSRGGFRISYDNVRYVSVEVFIQLIQRGLVGTTTARSADMHAVIQNLTSEGRSVVIAVKSRWENADQTT